MTDQTMTTGAADSTGQRGKHSFALLSGLRRTHLFSVSSAALLTLGLTTASFAQEVVEITGDEDEPQETATADDGAPADILITGSGDLEIEDGTIPAVTINSDNTLTNEGDIRVRTETGAIGVELIGGFTGGIENNGLIELISRETDQDDDGNFLPRGSNKTGILVSGTAPFTGDIFNDENGSIVVEGEESFGLRLLTDLQGDISNIGSVLVTGANSVALSAEAAVSGLVINADGASISASGAGARGIVLEQGAGGFINNQLVETDATDPDFVAEDADDDGLIDNLPVGGTAVSVGGTLQSGFLNNGLSSLTADDDAETQPTDGLTGAGVISSRGAPYAVLISPSVSGTPQDIFLGAVGDNEELDFGFVNRGQITSEAIDIGQSVTTIRIEGSATTTTELENGLNNIGQIFANGGDAETTGVAIGPGAVVPLFTNGGAISAQTSSTDGGDVSAILIESGGTITAIENTSTIVANAATEVGQVSAISDLAGTVASVLNRGNITAANAQSTPDNRARAFNFGTGNLDRTITNEGIIVGEIVLGGGNDSLSLLEFFDPDAEDGDPAEDEGDDTEETVARSTLSGDIDFGAGQNLLDINGGIFTGSTTHSGTLDIVLQDGELNVGLNDRIEATSLSLGAGTETTLNLSADDANQAKIALTGLADISDEATVNVELETLFADDIEFDLISAGTLNLNDPGSVVQTDIGFLFESELFRPDEAPDTLRLRLRTRTAEELGLNANQSSAFDAVREVLSFDDQIASPIINAETEEEFDGNLDQLLPDSTGRTRDAAIAIQDLLGTVRGDRFDALRRAGAEPSGLSLWTQVVGGIYQRDATEDNPAYDGFSAGLVVGLDAPFLYSDALGISLAAIASRLTLDGLEDEDLDVDSFQASLYGSWSVGSAYLDLSGHIGSNSIRSERQFLLPNANDPDDPIIVRESEADRDGTEFGATARLGYIITIGDWSVDPYIGAFYLDAQENAFTEFDFSADDDPNGFNLAIDDVEYQSFRTRVGTDISWIFDRQRRVNLEALLRLAYQQEFEDEAILINARFADGTTDFTQTTPSLSQNGVLAGGGIRLFGDETSVSFTADSLIQDDFFRINGALNIRVKF